MEFDLFVVYAVADRDFVHGYLLPALNLPPSRVQLVDQLTPGAPLVAEIERGVSRSRFTVAVLSAAYLVDRWAVFGEQMASYLSVEGVRVVPLLLTECAIPLHLEVLVALDFVDQSRWDTEAARFREMLRTIAPAVEQIACPYPGMRPFTTDEANWFFGRDKEIDDLIGRLDRGEREIYVIGPSGSGKSSLVQAGLLHILDAGSSRLGRSFIVHAMRPGERPTERLAHAFGGELEAPAATIDALVAHHPAAERVLVFVDQLEEVFTLADVAERQRFIAALCALRTEPRCYLLLALRADFYGALMESVLWPELAGRMSRIEVAPLRRAALIQAVSAPALRRGVHLEARLCDRLVADAADEPGVLPHVQETLRLLWDRRRQRLLGLVDYEALGSGASGLHMAIARHADATIRALTITQQTIARRVLLRLVSFGEGRVDTRRQQKVQSLCSTVGDGDEFRFVLQRLVDERLVTLDGDDKADDALADLSHEALITAWPEFKGWIERRRSDEQQRRRLEARVDEWIARGRGKWRLLDIVEFSEHKQWMQSDAARELGCPSELSLLVEASRDEIASVERQRRRQAFRAVVVLAVVVILLVTSILGFVAWRQWQDSRHRLGQLYLKEGQDRLREDHPMQALPYLVAANTEATEIMVPRLLLAQALRTLPLVTFVGHDAAVAGVSFSADGRHVVTASDDMTARVWDVLTGKPVGQPLRHAGLIYTAVFSYDGKHVVTASDDKTARVWNTLTGEPITPPLQHQDFVYAAMFSPDGSRVVTASADKTARVWDAATGEPLTQPLEHQGEVSVAMFSPDGKRIVTAGRDKTARIWDAITGAPVILPLKHSEKVTVASFSPDGARVVTVSGDMARVWDASTGNPITTLLGHSRDITAASFSPDGALVVTASLDATARVWDAAGGQALIAAFEHQEAIRTAVFSPDGMRVVTASDDNTARVWDVKTAKLVSPPLEHQDIVYTAAFSPDGARVITASGDKMARIWDASTRPVSPPLEHRGFVNTAVFSPDGTRVITASQDRTAMIWDTLTGKPVTLPLKHQRVVYAAAFSPDGTRVVTASQDRTARIWDASTGRSVTLPLEHPGSVFAAAFDPDGTHVVTASEDKAARVWDVATGTLVIELLGHQGQVNDARFSPDGKRVVTSSFDNTAQVWNVSTGRRVTPPLKHKSFVLTAAFSPDGRYVVTTSGDKTAQVWDAETGQPATPPLVHQGLVHTASFNHDGTRVVTASEDGTARVWDAATGWPVTPPLKHQGFVYAAAFNSEGTLVVTAGLDKTARVWNASTGQPMSLLLEHQGPVHTAVFSPDGARVVTASEDHTARVWVLDDIKSAPVWTLGDKDLFDRLRLLSRCSPFAQINGELTANSDPIRVCPPH